MAARLTRAELNPLGGEFRAQVQLGSTPLLMFEYFQPLDYASRWFVNREMEWSKSGSSVFDLEGIQRAELASDNLRVILAAGRQFGNWGEFRIGLSHIFGDTSLRIGPPEFNEESSHIASIEAGFEFDTLNRLSVPTHGTSVSLNWVGPRTDLGSDFDIDVATLSIVKPQTFGANTLLHWWSLGTTTSNRSLGFTPFDAGGLFTLSGFAPQSLSGQHVGVGRLLFYRNIGNPIASAFNTRVYLGASIAVGNVWNDTRDIRWNNTRTAGSLFLVVDSLVGPLYLGYGAAQGGRRSLYLFLGQTF